MSTSNIYTKLTKIQNDLKAPKSQRNDFGKYNYRNCEDILEAAKPLLLSEGLTLVITDNIVCVGNRFYVQATAVLTDGEQIITNNAFARESDEKKGMDDSQVTGATSSYCRKYCLNGLFLIDDTKDADSMDNSAQASTQAPQQQQNTQGNQAQNNQSQQDDANKPWYNSFDDERDFIKQKIQSGESTPEQIIAHLANRYKINTKIREEIKSLATGAA